MGLWESFLNLLRSYVVEADNLSISKSELHDLLSKPRALSKQDLTDEM